eukprot:373388-Pyramimonas_sp.AAC.2
MSGSLTRMSSRHSVCSPRSRFSFTLQVLGFQEALRVSIRVGQYVGCAQSEVAVLLHPAGFRVSIRVWPILN